MWGIQIGYIIICVYIQGEQGKWLFKVQVGVLNLHKCFLWIRIHSAQEMLFESTDMVLAVADLN